MWMPLYGAKQASIAKRKPGCDAAAQSGAKKDFSCVKARSLGLRGVAENK